MPVSATTGVLPLLSKFPLGTLSVGGENKNYGLGGIFLLEGKLIKFKGNSFYWRGK